MCFHRTARLIHNVPILVDTMTEYCPQFFTASIVNWYQLLKPDKYKEVIIDSMRFLVNNKRVNIYAFAIMPNHVHIIWSAANDHQYKNIQRDFLKFTAQRIKFDLVENHPMVLEKFESNRKDRAYQFWQNRALSIPLYTEKVFQQKLNYLHNNPIQPHWNLCEKAEDYKYSTAGFYENGVEHWDFITNYF